LSGREVFTIQGLSDSILPHSQVSVRAARGDGSAVIFKAIVRLDTETEIEYYRNGGVLHTVLRNLLR
jgi:aconitate hydratase